MHRPLRDAGDSLMTREEFLQAIQENPRDDQVRLVFADWLEERGDPRGEFIRAQFAVLDDNLDSARCKELTLRMHELRDEHEAEWLGPLGDLVSEYTFRRGFIDEVI